MLRAPLPPAAESGVPGARTARPALSGRSAASGSALGRRPGTRGQARPGRGRAPAAGAAGGRTRQRAEMGAGCSRPPGCGEGSPGWLRVQSRACRGPEGAFVALGGRSLVQLVSLANICILVVWDAWPPSVGVPSVPCILTTGTNPLESTVTPAQCCVAAEDGAGLTLTTGHAVGAPEGHVSLEPAVHTGPRGADGRVRGGRTECPVRAQGGGEQG